MALYFLSYDVRNNGDYQKLYDELANFKAVQVLESVWSFERVNTTPAGLKNYFRRFVTDDDGLVVIQASGWAGSKLDGIPPTPADWK
ncbi:hypothetical protein WJ78_03030 [Burkholderia ubonensis]|uniref:hypothetical protein n=1 Tax=Burkholderia ubonensis TaxID=101571 RepID=UPI00075281F3|nr:hypothetical protein [Burkholderia ubonensis]KVO73162.1 hypothetical protein WJ78_03030 [Burkholderia ubonensis]KVP83886.1 hypothetical protein WJ97_32545 [Burkholderia ubonensis]OJB44741.1 hypothetical protein BGV57_07425 [Burkholderia ubonensis]